MTIQNAPGDADMDNPCRPIRKAFRRVLEAVEAADGPTLRELRGRYKGQPLADWRHVTIWLLRTRTCLGVQAIGRLLNRNHTMVPFAVEKVNQASDPRLRFIRDTVLRSYERSFTDGPWQDWEI